MTTVTLQHLGKYFGRTCALHGLDLAMADGEFVALLGHSGCGKSTALRLVAGLEYPDDGAVHIGGRDCTDVPAGERDIAMVFQSGALYKHMTVFDNIAFALKRQKPSPQEEWDRVHKVAEPLDIVNLLHRKPDTLSGGQRQRVALARALVRDASLYLYDEPFSSLDEPMRLQLRGLLGEQQRRRPRTTLHVTHDQQEAMTLADRIVVLREGRVQQTGTPADIYLRPANRFVAGFIGRPEMNFLTLQVRGEQRRADPVPVVAPVPAPAAAGDIALTLGQVTAAVPAVADQQPSGLHLVGPGMDLPVPTRWLGPLQTRREKGDPQVQIGIRPGHLSLRADGMPWQWPVRFDTALWDGEQTRLEGRLVREAGTRLVVMAPGDHTALAGQVLTVGADPAQVHGFAPGATGAALWH